MPNADEEIVGVEPVEAIRRRPLMYVVDTGSFGLLWLFRDLLACPRDPTRIRVRQVGTTLEIEAAAVAPSVQPRTSPQAPRGTASASGCRPPFLLEVCTNFALPLDDPPTLTGVETLDLNATPPTFVQTGQAPVALVVANALSSYFELASRLGGTESFAAFTRGVLNTPLGERHTSASDGLCLRFTPDQEIFSCDKLWFQSLAEAVRDVAMVRRVSIELTDGEFSVRFGASGAG